MSDNASVLMTPEEAADALRIGRSTCYELLASGALASVRIGRSRRIPRQALDDYVASLTAAHGAA